MDTNILDALAWTIIHSLWQGAALFIILVAYFWRYKHNADIKFKVAFGALLVIFFSFVATFIYQIKEIEKVVNSTSLISFTYYISEIQIKSNEFDIVSFLNNNTSIIANFWMLGFTLFMIRYVISYVWLNNLSSKSKSINLKSYGINLSSVKTSLGINRDVNVVEFGQYVSPFTSGVLKPVIFFPVSLLNNLSIVEIESILAHELAHIKRNDYLINLLSALIEVVMYYHPIVWWLGNQMDTYREQACDDIAVSYTKDPVSYAKSLVSVQEKLKRNNIPEFALAFTNQKENKLLNRIKRIFNMTYSPINIKEKFLASLILFTMALGITEIYAQQTKNKDLSIATKIKSELAQFNDHSMVTDSLPKQGKKKDSVHIISKSENKEVELKMEDGNVIKLQIDGKEIPPSEYEAHRHVIEDLKPLSSKSSLLKRKHLIEDKILSLPFDISEGHFGHGFNFNFPHKNLDMDSLLDKNFIHNYKNNFNFNVDSMFDRLSFLKIHGDSLHNLKIFDGGNFKLAFPEGNFDFGNIIGHFPEGQFDFVFPESLSKDFSIGGSDEDDLDILEDDEITEHHNWRDDRNLEELIGTQLNKDGFLIGGKMNTVELSGKNLKINGEKQPGNIWNKYKTLFERETGLSLTKDTKLVFQILGKTAKRKFKAF